jgi:SP family general alpha glucoside:H+ symporter-like MFS transporter
MGILLSSGVVKSTTTWDSNNNWAWRLPFVLQWIWVIPLFLIVFFSPQSPWWLVRQNRLEEAEQSLARLTNPEYVKPQDLKNTVAMMVHTNEMEKQLEEGTTYLQCFKGIDRRRTEVTCMVFAMRESWL